jgi:hypothetical protein
MMDIVREIHESMSLDPLAVAHDTARQTQRVAHRLTRSPEPPVWQALLSRRQVGSTRRELVVGDAITGVIAVLVRAIDRHDHHHVGVRCRGRLDIDGC